MIHTQYTRAHSESTCGDDRQSPLTLCSQFEMRLCCGCSEVWRSVGQRSLGQGLGDKGVEEREGGVYLQILTGGVQRQDVLHQSHVLRELNQLTTSLCGQGREGGGGGRWRGAEREGGGGGEVEGNRERERGGDGEGERKGERGGVGGEMGERERERVRQMEREERGREKVREMEKEEEREEIGGERG